MLGFEFKPDYTYTMEELFAPKAGSLILELKDGATLSEDVLHYTLGTTNESSKITVNGESLELKDLIEAWTSPLEKVFPTKAEVLQEYHSRSS